MNTILCALDHHHSPKQCFHLDRTGGNFGLNGKFLFHWQFILMRNACLILVIHYQTAPQGKICQVASLLCHCSSHFPASPGVGSHFWWWTAWPGQSLISHTPQINSCMIVLFHLPHMLNCIWPAGERFHLPLQSLQLCSLQSVCWFMDGWICIWQTSTQLYKFAFMPINVRSGLWS